MFVLQKLQYSFSQPVCAVWFFVLETLKDKLCQWLLLPIFITRNSVTFFCNFFINTFLRIFNGKEYLSEIILVFESSDMYTTDIQSLDTSKGFSQFCNSHSYSILLAYAGSMLYAVPTLLDIYTIDAHSINFQFCSLIAFPSLLEQCYILMQYLLVIYSSNLVLLLVSFNVYVTPSFFQLCSLSVFFLCLFFYTFYTFQFKFDYLVILSF